MAHQHVGHIVVADSRPLERVGITAILHRAFTWSKLETADTFAQVEEELRSAPSLMLIDSELPGLHDFELIRKLRLACPETRIVVVAATCDADRLLTILRSGVHGIIPKSLAREDFVAALRSVMKGHLYVPRDLSESAVRPNSQQHSLESGGRARQLSSRQREVLRLAAAGRSNKEIARFLKIAEATVKVHVSAAFRVIGVHNRAGALAALSGLEDGQGQLELRR